MQKETYRIVSARSGWAVDHDGKLEGDYETKEAAFEAAVGAASRAMRAGLAVSISVEGSEEGEPNLGRS